MNTIAVLITGMGRGAVATVLIDGCESVDVVQRLFRNAAVAKSGFRINKTYFGEWVWLDYKEELVVCRTDPHRFEIHCHGGPLAPRLILDSLIAHGVKEISCDDWLARSEPDRFVREAQLLLPDVKTERLLGIVLDQVKGAMRSRLTEILSLLSERHNQTAKQHIQQLIEMGNIGTRITRPFTVVLSGPPNAGKSSLINAIVGFERSIVFDQPGTTRDLVNVETALDGWPFTFTDTAGIRDSNDAIEQAGIRLAQGAIERADLVMPVRDLTSYQPVEELFTQLPHYLVVGTKADLLANDFTNTVDVRTSAKTGEGISNLISSIVQRLIPVTPMPGTAVPLTDELVAELRDLLELVSDPSATSQAHNKLASLLAY